MSFFTSSEYDTNIFINELHFTWYANTEILCPEAAFEVDETVRCDTTLSIWQESITLAVRDPNNARVDAIMNVVIVPTDAPEAAITSVSENGG